MAIDKMTDRARELQREYMREWRRRNKDRIKGYNQAYWMRKAKAEEKEGGNDGTKED